VRRVALFTALAAALAALAERAGHRLDPDALRAAAPVWLWLVVLVVFAAPHRLRVPAAVDVSTDADPVRALAEVAEASPEPAPSGALVGAVLPLAALLPAWCAAARWFGAPGDVWPLAALAAAGAAAGAISTTGRAVGALGALIAAVVALTVGPPGWARVLETERAPLGAERPAALLGVTVALDGPMEGAEVGYPELPPLRIEATLAAGESVVVRALVPGPPPDEESGALDPLAGDPAVRVDGDGAAEVRSLAAPARFDAVAEAALARARPPAAAIARSGAAEEAGGRALAGWLLVVACAAAAMGASAAATRLGALAGLAATLALTAVVGWVPLAAGAGGARGPGAGDAEPAPGPAHTVHEGQRLAAGGLAWRTVERRLLPARIRADELDRVTVLPGARVPRCRAVVRGGDAAVWLLPPAPRAAAVDVVAPAEDLRYAVVTPEVNSLGDLEEAWWRSADGAVRPLGPWPRGAARPEPVPAAQERSGAPPDWGFAGAPVGREGLLGRLPGGPWVRVVR